MTRTEKRDPVRRIFKTNNKVFRKLRCQNTTLLKILERVELDKPILMFDKLKIIWDQDS